jgi:hypothetical protein
MVAAVLDLAPWRPKTGLQPRLAGVELVTLAVMQALPGFASESRWIRHAVPAWSICFLTCWANLAIAGGCAHPPG